MKVSSIVSTFFFLATPLALCAQEDPFLLWEKIKAPTPAPAMSIGFYSAGCIAGAEKLEPDGPGYSVMRLSRARNYGHPSLTKFVRDFAALAKKKKIPRILVGDLGRPRGGPMVSGHASHQVGLDVDIWLKTSKRKPLPAEREQWNSPSWVAETKKGWKLKKGWGNRQRSLLALASSFEQVDRIFVHPAIKADLCRKFSKSPWIDKVRPWWGHDSHFHVRLKCPKDSPNCQNQEPVETSSCGKSLDWWLSEEAKEELKKKRATIGKVFPLLPADCQRMVNLPSEEGGPTDGS